MSLSSMTHSAENSPLNTEKNLGNLQDVYHSESSTVDTRVTQESHGSSPYGSVFIVVNAALGAGLLTFPYAFYLAGGWYWGVVLQVCFLPLAMAGIMILVYCAELHQASSYETMIESMFGSIAKGIIELCVAIYCFGSCLTYLVVIGDQIADVTSAFQYDGESLSVQWWVNRKLLITVMAILFIYPWLFLKRIGLLSYTSFFGVLACVYIAAVVTANYFIFENHHFNCSMERYIPQSCSTSVAIGFNAIPFVCFAYQCHVSSIPVYYGIRGKSVKKFFFIAVAGLSLCLVVYTLTGVFGLLTFVSQGECLNSDVLRNYCPTDIPVSVARGMMIFCLLTSYPILHFPGRLAIDSVILKFMKLCNQNVSCNDNRSKSCCTAERVRAWAESSIWFALSLVLALFVPQIKYVVSPLGCLAAAFIMVLPGLCLLKLSFDHFRNMWTKLISGGGACCMIVIGAFIMGNSFTYNIMLDFNKI